MQAILLLLAVSVIPLIAWRSYNKEKENIESVLRYGIYVLLIIVLSSIVMKFMSEEGVSFLEKVDWSPNFMIKYIILLLCFAFFIAIAEWAYCCKKLELKVDVQQYKDMKPVGFFQKYIFPNGLYILAVLVVILNVVLIFDNALWGDEAFSANTAQKTMGGILQVLYYWDCHPPLYYYWLKLFGEVLGHTGPVYHLASIVPFTIGIVLAVTLFKKRFGAVPAAFFVIISGLGKACLEYNLEIRMYALAFLCITACFYCSYRVLSGEKKSAWVGMVLWGLAAAYSHYYALVTAGILVFFTGVAVWIKHRGKSWWKGLLAVVLFIVGYAPWLYFLFNSMKTVSNSWWITEIMGLDQCLDMIMGSEGMKGIIFPLFVILLVIVFVADASIVELRKKDEKLLLHIHAPSGKNWSDEAYALLVGVATITCTILFGYVMSYILNPLLTSRYLYPASAITVMMLVIGSSRVLSAVKQSKEPWFGKYLYKVIYIVFVLVLLMLLVKGLQNYKVDSAVMREHGAKTDATLEAIGTPDEDVKMVSTGVQHLTWTVLYYYFPDNEVVAGSFREADADKYWYFTANYFTPEELQELQDNNYTVLDYGPQQLAKYGFILYYIEKQ